MIIMLSGLIHEVNVSRAALNEGQEEVTEQLSMPRSNQQNEPYSLTISGNSHFSEKELLKAAAAELQVFKQRGYRKADIDDAAFQMRLTYLQAGFAFAFVDYAYVQKDNVIRVVFTIEEGPRVFVQGSF
jgi:outer membrane protein assembly factor BamA